MLQLMVVSGLGAAMAKTVNAAAATQSPKQILSYSFECNTEFNATYDFQFTRQYVLPNAIAQLVLGSECRRTESHSEVERVYCLGFCSEHLPASWQKQRE